MSQHPFHKVIWSEGLLVSPQHFQQTDRYHESNLDVRVRPLVPYGWGVTDLKIDFTIDRYQKNGTLQVARFCGVLRSGTTIDIPHGDAMPDSRVMKLQDFPGTVTDVYLALPVDQPGGLNYGMDCNTTLKDTRYVAKFVSVEDETNTESQQEIAIAHKNFKLLFGSELSDAYERIKIAELVKQKDGSIIVNPDYVPACLVFSASIYLSSLLQDLAHQLTHVSTALLAARHPRAKRHEAKEAHLETLWLLSFLNPAVALLNHFNHVQQIHPEVVYCSLLQLAGQLDALSATPHSGLLPAYDHENLAVCFSLLNQMIDVMLKEVSVPETEYLRVIELEEAVSAAGYNVLRARLLDEHLLSQDHRFYLVVEVAAVEPDRQKVLVDMLPDMITVAAFEQIDDYIERAYGLRLTHVRRPSGAPPKAGAIYLQLETLGSTWEHIRSLKTLAVYIPREFERELKRIDVDLMIRHDTSAPHEQVIKDADGQALSA